MAITQHKVPRTVRPAGEDHRATPFELFFDLVFVFAVTQVTVLTAHHLDPGGILRSLLLFWLIWWAWTQFTWTLNPADTTHAAVRLVTLVATGAAFGPAPSVAGIAGSVVVVNDGTAAGPASAMPAATAEQSITRSSLGR